MCVWMQLMERCFCMSRRVPVFNVGNEQCFEFIYQGLERRSDAASVIMDIGSLDREELRRYRVCMCVCMYMYVC